MKIKTSYSICNSLHEADLLFIAINDRDPIFQADWDDFNTTLICCITAGLMFPGHNLAWPKSLGNAKVRLTFFPRNVKR